MRKSNKKRKKNSNSCSPVAQEPATGNCPRQGEGEEESVRGGVSTHTHMLCVRAN